MFCQCLTCGEILLDPELTIWCCPRCGSEDWSVAQTVEPDARHALNRSEPALTTCSTLSSISQFKSKLYWKTRFSLS